MKPISVRFRCFGPYISEQIVRFDKLAEYGLFLICGETGSGKTTILDAICCALYGSCSGDIRGKLDAMRCKQASPEDPTEVEYVFESGGKRYRFQRKLTQKRNAERKISYNEDYSCCVDVDGHWVPLLDNCKKTHMNAKAEEVIGLSLEQFRRVIILPQGKFETLLTSNSEEKESILSSLFHTERWEKVVDKMANELNKQNREIEPDTQRIKNALEKLEVSSVADLPEIVGDATKAAEDAEKAMEKAKSAKEQAETVLSLSKEFQELDERQKKMDDAKKAAEGDHDLKDRLENAIKAEKARQQYDAWKQAESKLNKAEERLMVAQEEMNKAKEEREKAEADQKAHLDLEPEKIEREKELERLSAFQSQYTNIEKQQENASKAKNIMENAKEEKKKADDSLRAEQEKLQNLQTAWNEAGEKYRRISKAYQALSAGHLAKSLKEGECCPVCGSRHHPCLAELPKGAVTDKDVEDADKKQSKAMKNYEEQKKAKENAEGMQRIAENTYQTAKTEFDKADGALNEALKQRHPEIKTLQELNDRYEKLKSEIDKYEQEKDKLAEIYRKADINFKTKENLLKDKTAEKEEAATQYTEKETVWKEALEKTGLGTETQYIEARMSVDDQNELRKTLAEHEASLKAADDALREQLKKLEGKIRPEAELAERTFKEADKLYVSAIEKKTLATNKKTDLEKEAKYLEELDSKIADKQKAYDDDSRFVNALRGSSSMSIQRYVLSVRLGQVIGEANRLLSGIYGGRYRLHRSDESYGTEHKKGLELEVYDSMNDQYRSVCTLSGGEKFLVALTLAIGLRTVVQNEQKGVSMEAMFIDEGFGSLDQSSMGDALDILQGVQRGRGFVGIISHIQLLEETIPTKIIIEKTAHGSKKTEVYG